MVSLRARQYISGPHSFRLLSCSSHTTPSDKLAASQDFNKDTDNIVSQFDKNAKHSFSGPEAASLVKFGSIGQTDPAFDIKRGSLRIAG